MLFLSSQTIRDAEVNAMENISSIQLIRNAAAACCEQTKKFSSVRVYCGKGNNGSDGYATAVILKKLGKTVEIVKVDEPKTEECIFFHNEAAEAGIPILKVSDFLRPDCECILDAVFGIGISGDIAGDAFHAINEINASGCFVVSADIPSGLNSDSGERSNVCVRADKTVTFTAPKMGMLSRQSVDVCGEIIVRDVGIPVDYSKITRSRCVPITSKLVKSILPERNRLSHKGTFGTAVIVAGSKGMAGAAAMAAAAAYKSGCGLVKIIAPESICDVLNILIKEAVVIASPEKDGVLLPTLSESGTAAVQTADSILVGCGLGKGKHDELISNILSVTDKGVIIDADGINALSGKLNIIKNKNVLLTPHPLEFSRLSGIDVSQTEKHRIQSADAFAKEYGVSILLKGARSVIAYGGSNIYVSLGATSALSKGGSGDILSGIIVSLAAQGISLTDSAAAGCFIHTAAGFIAENEIGSIGTTADDIINIIPKAVNKILIER